MESVASLLLDEDYGASARRRASEQSPAETSLKNSSSAKIPLASTPRRVSDVPNTFRGFVRFLWDALLAEDGDDWADERRGRGGTPSGARALANVERGVEQEMEVVLRTDAAGSLARTGSDTPSSFARRRRRGSGGGGYFFGEVGEGADDDENDDDGDDEELSSDDEEVSSRPPPTDLPNVFPGIPAECAGDTMMDELAAEMQKLWGTPSSFESADDCRDLIRALSEADVIRAAMDERLEQWVLRTRVRGEDGEVFGREDLLEFWRRRVTDLCDTFLQALMKAGGRFESCSTTPRHRESLVHVVEGYVMGALQRRILEDGIFPMFVDEDAFVSRRFDELASLPIEALGLDAVRYGKLIEDAGLIELIASMSDLSCPAHVASRAAIATTHVLNAGGTDGEPMNADDLLFVLVAVIARAKIARPASLVAYIETFHALLSNAHKRERGFAVAHLTAAVRFAGGDEAGDLLRQRSNGAQNSS